MLVGGAAFLLNLALGLREWRTLGRRWLLGGTLVVGVAVAAGRSSVDSGKKTTTSSSTATTAATVPGGLVEFKDDKAGWAISYPRNWNRLQSQDADVVLVASEKPPELNNGGSILGRTRGCHSNTS